MVHAQRAICDAWCSRSLAPAGCSLQCCCRAMMKLFSSALLLLAHRNGAAANAPPPMPPPADATAIVRGDHTLPAAPAPSSSSQRPQINVLGTYDLLLVETTPVVVQSELYLFESVRGDYWNNSAGKEYLRFVHMQSGEKTPSFGAGCVSPQRHCHSAAALARPHTAQPRAPAGRT